MELLEVYSVRNFNEKQVNRVKYEKKFLFRKISQETLDFGCIYKEFSSVMRFHRP